VPTVVPPRDLTRSAIAVTLGLFVAQLFVASRLELMFDEAYYRLWAEHLDWGYYDHPPGVAAWIRLSSALFGHTDFGIRALGIIATALGSLAIWAMARDLFADAQKAALAVLIWCACPLVGVGGLVVTPDTPLMVGWTTALVALCRVYRTGDWRWWLLVGAATGVALEAKYTALFLGPGIVLAMLLVKSMRRWWTHPAPYAGGAIAFLIFAPNVVWNARHGWQTFGKQFGRVAEADWTLRFLFEFLGGQIGLMNPLTFVLVIAAIGLAWRSVGDGEDESRKLLAALAAPLVAFFVFHSLHDRVQANWMAPLFPLFVLMAADAAISAHARAAWAAMLVAFARRWTVPLGLVLTAAVYVQALYAPIPLPGRSDPTALLAGWRQLSADLADVARREGASYALTQGYALTGLLKAYAPSDLAVMQFNERYRWAFDATAREPEASATGLYVVEERRAGDVGPRPRFESSKEVARLERRRLGKTLEGYTVYRLDRPKGAILDPVDARPQ